MQVPTLEDLAVEKVVNNIVDEIPVLNNRLYFELSNRVFKKLCTDFGHPTAVMVEIMMNSIMPSEVDLSHFNLQEYMITYLNNLRLTYLKLGEYRDLANYIRTEMNEGETRSLLFVDIAKLLSEILNGVSRNELRHLELTSFVSVKKCQFEPNWVPVVGGMLPNLTVLNVSEKKLSASDFSCITTAFPNLVELDITHTGITKLNGISQLNNLKKLAIGRNPIKTARNLSDLSNCDNLEYLNFSRTSTEFNKLLKLFVFSGRGLPELKYLNVVGTCLNDANLEHIFNRYPKLTTVAANRTYISLTRFNGKTIFNSNSVQARLVSLTHFREQRDRYSLLEVLIEFYEKVRSMASGSRIQVQQQLTLLN